MNKHEVPTLADQLAKEITKADRREGEEKDVLFERLDELTNEFRRLGLEQDAEVLSVAVKKDIAGVINDFKRIHAEVNDFTKKYESRPATLNDVFNYEPSTSEIGQRIFDEHRFDYRPSRLISVRQVAVSFRSKPTGIAIGYSSSLGYSNTYIGKRESLEWYVSSNRPPIDRCASYGLSRHAERLFLQKFGAIKDATDDNEYWQLFESGRPPKSEDLEFCTGAIPINADNGGVGFSIWKWRQRKTSGFDLDRVEEDSEQPISISAILMTMDQRTIAKMAGFGNLEQLPQKSRPHKNLQRPPQENIKPASQELLKF